MSLASLVHPQLSHFQKLALSLVISGSVQLTVSRMILRKNTPVVPEQRIPRTTANVSPRHPSVPGPEQRVLRPSRLTMEKVGMKTRPGSLLRAKCDESALGVVMLRHDELRYTTRVFQPTIRFLCV